MEDKNKLTKQMKCAIGEQLVAAHLIAHGWPTVNVNSTIDNFKGIDLFCQHGVDPKEEENLEIVGVQVKTTFQSIKANISVGLTCKQAADLETLKKRIKNPWVFVHVKGTDPLEVDFYVLTAKQLIDVLYELHKWYLYGWEKRPCTESLEGAMACIRIDHIWGHEDVSRFSTTKFDNPLKGVKTLNNWNNIWVKD